VIRLGEIHLRTPLSGEDVRPLRAGDRVLLSGELFTARDAAHARLVDLIADGRPLPFRTEGSVIYYTGPAPTPPHRSMGSAGPTTSGRMDPYTPQLLAQGIRATVGKGTRSREVIAAMQKYGAVYLAAVGGAGALIARCVKEVEVIAYPELGPEAIRRLVVEDFPAVVINDVRGGDLYREQGPEGDRV